MDKYFSVILSIAIFLIFWYTLFHDTLNIPSFDDYDATLVFIKQFYFESQSFSDRISVLFLRHNEHRILLSKLAASGYFGIFGQVNFGHLVILQNLFLLGFFGIIVSVFKKEKQLSSTAFLFITAFLFSFSLWQVSFYYWAGIQHYTVFFFSFTSLIVLDKTEKVISPHFLLAVFLALFSVFSFGNGFLALLLGVFLLFAQKKYPVLVTWMIISLAILIVTFFIDFQIHGQSGEAFKIEWMARLLFTFLGSFLYINPSSGQHFNILVCMFAGAFVLLFWVYLFFSGYALKKPLLYSLFSLPILTGIIISISRFETKAAGGIAPRYMFFTATIPILLLLILLDMKIVKKAFLNYLAGAVVLLWGVTFYNNLVALKSMNTQIVSTVRKWQYDKSIPLVYYHNAEGYTKTLQWAINQHVVQNRIYFSSVRSNYK
ncbi:hypothetical protein [Dyadobacter sp. NIV53]|uniref:hypothetical protein n=1 Tax=Dyadobacter sp. NIV53 TaxID=2861765 RepID=UPI001C85EDF6|nr:hypothetical protein [Dyadobacter sp. NIV53]